jgi:hypothetical protein
VRGRVAADRVLARAEQAAFALRGVREHRGQERARSGPGRASWFRGEASTASGRPVAYRTRERPSATRR